MTPVLGYTTLYSQRIIGLKKNIPAYLLQYIHNISISPHILCINSRFSLLLTFKEVLNMINTFMLRAQASTLCHTIPNFYNLKQEGQDGPGLLT